MRKQIDVHTYDYSHYLQTIKDVFADSSKDEFRQEYSECITYSFFVWGICKDVDLFTEFCNSIWKHRIAMYGPDTNVQFPQKPADARRGFMPADEKDFSPSALETLRTASRHIVYLINEGYDIKSASTFVGNHFALAERQRLALVRSISTTGQLDKRRAKELASLEGREVWIDGFNTVITLEVLLNASPLFACMDGTVRDLAALRGTYRIITETGDAIRILLRTLAELKAASAHILLDAPVSNSGRLKSLIADVKEELGERCPFGLDIQLLKEVDKELWTKENVITADAIILDHCTSWFNLMPVCVKELGARTLRVWE